MRKRRVSPFVLFSAPMVLFLALAPHLRGLTSSNVSAWDNLKLGDTVWDDTNNDGLLNNGEKGIPGVTVNLYRWEFSQVCVEGGTTHATTTTDANGKYLFTDLDDTNYVVTIPASQFAAGGALAGYSSSTGATNQYEPAPDPDDDINNDDNGTTTTSGCVKSGEVTMQGETEPTNDGDTDNTTNLTIDFGFHKPLPEPEPEPVKLSLGDTVWRDTNNNGIQDTGEAGIDGVDVRLFSDANNDGAYSSADGAPLATKTTSGGGKYLFDNLDAGNYIVVIPQNEFAAGGTLAGYRSSTGANNEYEPAPDPDNNINADDNGSAMAGNGVVSRAITLTENGEPTNDGDTDANSNLTVDFGVYLPTSPEPEPEPVKLSLGDTVWRDTNNNGIQDSGENGVQGVDVRLFRDVNNDGMYSSADGNALATQTTNANGKYLFTNLDAGNYIVVIPQAEFSAGGTLAGYRSSTGTNGAYEPAPDPDNDINADDNGTAMSGNGVVSRVVTLTENGEPTNDGDTDANSNLTVDFGVYLPTSPEPEPEPIKLSLGDTVWNDINNSGTIDNNEAGITGVDLQLFRDVNNDGAYSSADGTSPLQTKTTDTNGKYLFTNLDEGNYLVVIPQNEFNAGATLEGYKSSTGKNASATGPFEPAPDPDNNVNSDDNGTAVENGGVVAKAVTLKINEEPTNDGDTDANSNLTVDFGVFKPARLGDYVWFDTDKDGVQDNDENPVPNITVILCDPATMTTISTTVTGTDGKYIFDNLAPGQYCVTIPNLPANTAVTIKDAGSDDAKDSDIDQTTHKTGSYTLTPGESNLTVDAGIISTVTPTPTPPTPETPDRNGLQGDGSNQTAQQQVRLANTGSKLLVPAIVALSLLGVAITVHLRRFGYSLRRQ